MIACDCLFFAIAMIWKPSWSAAPRCTWRRLSLVVMVLWDGAGSDGVLILSNGEPIHGMVEHGEYQWSANHEELTWELLLMVTC